MIWTLVLSRRGQKKGFGFGGEVGPTPTEKKGFGFGGEVGSGDTFVLTIWSILVQNNVYLV